MKYSPAARRGNVPVQRVLDRKRRPLPVAVMYAGDIRQVGSLAGAAHLLNHNAGVLRGTHGEQKSPVEQKGKSPLDFDFQCEYKP